MEAESSGLWNHHELRELIDEPAQPNDMVNFAASGIPSCILKASIVSTSLSTLQLFPAL